MYIAWREYLVELREEPLIGPGLRQDWPPLLRRTLHFLFMTLHYAGFYLLQKPLCWLIIRATMRLERRGRQNMPARAQFIGTSNHLSSFDIILGAAVTSRPLYVMAKAEYFKTPIFGGLATAMGGFPVRRGEADRYAFKVATNVLKRGLTLALYPEGTRSKTYKLQPGQPGAALFAATSNVPVLPTAVWGSENIARRSKWGFLNRPPVVISFGPIYNLKEEATAFAQAHRLTLIPGKRDDYDFLSDFMMLKIADLLPESYRGEFTPEGLVARFQERADRKGKVPPKASSVS